MGPRKIPLPGGLLRIQAAEHKIEQPRGSSNESEGSVLTTPIPRIKGTWFCCWHIFNLPLPLLQLKAIWGDFIEHFLGRLRTLQYLLSTVTQTLWSRVDSVMFVIHFFFSSLLWHYFLFTEMCRVISYISPTKQQWHHRT